MARQQQTAALPLDVRLIPKPPVLKGEDQWQEWKFKMANYLACLDPVYPAELEVAQAEVNPVTVADFVAAVGPAGQHRG